MVTLALIIASGCAVPDMVLAKARWDVQPINGHWEAMAAIPEEDIVYTEAVPSTALPVKRLVTAEPIVVRADFLPRQVALPLLVFLAVFASAYGIADALRRRLANG
jgi:hypothetical protein